MKFVFANWFGKNKYFLIDFFYSNYPSLPLSPESKPSPSNSRASSAESGHYTLKLPFLDAKKMRKTLNAGDSSPGAVIEEQMSQTLRVEKGDNRLQGSLSARSGVHKAESSNLEKRIAPWRSDAIQFNRRDVHGDKFELSYVSVSCRRCIQQ